MPLFSRHLAAILLLVSMLLAPLTSVAHSCDSAMLDDCARHMMLNDCWQESNDNQQEDLPCDRNSDYCDCDECCHDSAGPPFMHAIIADVSVRKQFYPYSHQILPKVYIDIYVPPEG